jgi:hypothetical protein
MTENTPAPNDPAAVLAAVEQSRHAARDVLTHGRHDFELIVITALIPAVVDRAADGSRGAAGWFLGLMLFLGIGVVLRIRRLHNLGGSIGVPTWIGMGIVLIATAIASAWLDKPESGWLVGTTYVVVLLGLSVVYRQALLAGIAVVVGVAVVCAAVDAPAGITISALVIGAAAVMFFGRKQFFGPRAA